MRILVTGALGLIGSEIVERLVPEHFVIGLDDESHNCIHPDESKVQQLVNWGVEECDVIGATSQIDLIIHCASPIGHARLTNDTAWRIVGDTRAVLELAERTKAKLITFSSSEVLAYRNETDVRAQYSLGKLTMEAMVLSSNVNARIIRPSNVTGKRQRADGGFVMARFREQRLSHKPLTIFGSGNQRRHFTHVSDFADLVLLLISKWPENRLWQPYIPDNNCSINELAAMFGGEVEHVAGAEVLANLEWRDTSERVQQLNNFAACCRLLGWNPQVGLERMVMEHLVGSLTGVRVIEA